MRSHGVLPNGEAIRQFRRLKGWSQEELAAKSNCSKTTIGRLETGVQRVHLRTLRQVAHAFDIAVEDLFISEPVQSMPLYSSSIVPVGSLNHTVQAALAQQSTWNLTYRRNLNFVGRESLLTALRDAWASNPTVPQVLSGLGGIGKTQLALEYAYRYASHYPTVLWVQADTAMTLANNFAALTAPLQLAERHALEPTTAIAAVQKWLEQHTDWLLVFDQVESAERLDAFLPFRSYGHILITSRNVNWRGFARRFAVPLWTPDDAVQFLIQRTGEDNEAQAMQLAATLGYLPLALEQAGAYIEASGITLRDYGERWTTHRSILLEHGSPMHYWGTVSTTWDISFDRVKHLSPAAMDLLYACAFLAPDEIPQDLLDELQPQAMLLDQAMDALRRYSIVESTEVGTYRVHRLVQAVIRDRLSGEAQAQWLQTVLAHLTSLLIQTRRTGESWWVAARLLPHAFAASGHVRALSPHVSLHSVELAFRLALGPVLTSIEGYAAPEVRRNFERAYDLSQYVPDTSDRFAALCGLWNVVFVEGRRDYIEPISRQLLDLAQQQQRSELWIEAYLRQGCALWQRGQLHGALDVFERAYALYGPSAHAFHSERYGPAPDVLLLFFLAMGTWLTGQLDKARQALQALLELAETLKHPFDLMFAYNSATVVASLRGDLHAMAIYNARALDLASQYGFTKWEMESWVYQGYLRIVQGQDGDETEGLALMTRGMTALEQAGVKVSQSHVRALLIERLAAAGQVCAGLRLITELLDEIGDPGNDYYSAELCRLRGELLRLQTPPDAEGAKSCFQQALSIATRQGAKSWALRAAMSMSRWWHQQGKFAAAYDLLAPLCDAFPANCDDADLQVARRLVEACQEER